MAARGALAPYRAPLEWDVGVGVVVSASTLSRVTVDGSGVVLSASLSAQKATRLLRRLVAGGHECARSLVGAALSPSPLSPSPLSPWVSASRWARAARLTACAFSRAPDLNEDERPCAIGGCRCAAGVGVVVGVAGKGPNGHPLADATFATVQRGATTARPSIGAAAEICPEVTSASGCTDGAEICPEVTSASGCTDGAVSSVANFSSAASLA